MQNWEWIAGTVSRRQSDQPLCLDYANNIERFNKKNKHTTKSAEQAPDS